MNIFLALFFLSYVSSDDNKITFPERTAKVGEFPYVVLIRRNISRLHGEKNWCGGILYSAIHVLTAAKCVAIPEKYERQLFYAYGYKERYLSEFTVYAGTINADGSDGESRKIKLLIVPPWMDWKHRILQQNIVIFVLKKGFPLNINIMPAPIKRFDKFGELSSAYEPYMGNDSYCLLPAWGYTNTTKHKFENFSSFSPAKQLKVAKFRPMPLKPCQTFLCDKKDSYCEGFGFSYESIFCGFPVNRKQDTCLYDEGSPLICDGQIYGILGWVEHEIGCSHGAPSGFVSGHMITWFLRNAFVSSTANLIKSSLIATIVAISNYQ